MGNKYSRILLFSLLIMAACGISYEYTFSKIASDFLGNSVRQWGIIIGLMMFFMGVGSDLQKFISDKKLLEFFIGIEILLALVGGFGGIMLLYVFSLSRAYYILMQYSLITLVGIFVGLEIPLITRINENYVKWLKYNIGSVLRMDYIGSFLGALAWTFILPRFFSIIEISFILGFCNIIVAIITISYFRNKIKYLFALLTISLLGLLGMIFGFLKSDNWQFYAEQYLYQDKIIFSKTTDYQHIVITKTKSDDIYCYINGNLQFSSLDEYIYHEHLVHPAFLATKHRKKVLILGGGDGLALREVLKYKDVKEVTLVDLDPQMTDIARDNKYLKELNKGAFLGDRVHVLKHNMNSFNQKRLLVNNELSLYQNKIAKDSIDVNILNLDATLFMEKISGYYDIIIADFPDPNNNELGKLYSLQFYQNVYRKLNHDGVFIQQSTSPYHSKEVFLCIARTMNAAGFYTDSYHDNVPSFGEWGWNIAFKTNRQLLDFHKNLGKDQELDVPTRYLNRKIIQISFVFADGQLKSDSDTINTILNNYISNLYQNYMVNNH